MGGDEEVGELGSASRSTIGGAGGPEDKETLLGIQVITEEKKRKEKKAQAPEGTCQFLGNMKY